MAGQAGRFTDDRYVNWIKDTLALMYLKEGLEVFVDSQSANFHGRLKAALGTLSCGSCTSQQLSKWNGKWSIQCNVCQPWLDQIISHHKYKYHPRLELAPRNTDPKLWTTHAWEVVKMYQAKGCQGQHSAMDTDVAGILAVVGNCDHFHRFIHNPNIIHDIRKIRNLRMHSPDLRVETVDLGRDLQTMLQFLRGLTLMSLSVAELDPVQKAITKIEELRTGTLDLALINPLELQALQLKQIALDSDIKCLRDDQQTAEDASNTIKMGLCTVGSDVKTLQGDVTAISTKATATEYDLKTQMEKMKEVEQRLQKLHAVQDSFNQFLQANNLEQDMAGLSSALEHHNQRIESLETQTQNLDVAAKKQEDEITTLYQRQKATDTELQDRQRDSHAHECKLQAHTTMLESQQGRLEHVEARLQNQADRVASEITYDDIPALQRRLKNYYRTMCLTVPNPVVSEECGFDCLYVDPDIKVLRETTEPNTGLETVQDQPTTASVSQCRQLFYTKDNRCRQIYITGDAGLGKSMFCKHLVDLWCKADSEIVMNTEDSISESSDDVFSFLYDREEAEKKMEEDRKILSEFKLLFYITLRESPDQYHVAAMINSQILQQDEELQHLEASKLLKKVPCLVIIDGLDEWVCPADAKIPRFVKPGIPGRDWLNKSNVFLTTTRPWKFDVLQLTSTEVDKHVELVGFNSYSTVALCSKITELLQKKERVQRIIGDFQAELQEKELSHLSSIPVILTQLICLWFDKQDIGKSQVQLYSSILEMLLKRADKNLPEQTCASTTENDCNEMRLPECLLKHKRCQYHRFLLFSLCKVAFEALFNQKREHSLVFESSQMEILGVDQDNVDLCLKSGILTQSKVLGKWSASEKKLSFLHKKLQEFLAALFVSCENTEHVISKVKQHCTSVESLLEMSQVFMFLSGVNYDVAKQLLAEMVTCVGLKDTHLQKYRQTLLEEYDIANSMQTCIVKCVEEATSNGHKDLCLPLEDFVLIGESTISTCLERLLKFNLPTIKSVLIGTRDMAPDTVKRLMCQLQDAHSLQKLDLHDLNHVITDIQLCQTLDSNKNRLTCLSLASMLLTRESYDVVCHIVNHVTALNMFYVRLTHKQIEQLILTVLQAQQIRQLSLAPICTDHGQQCRAGIDLSGLTQLHAFGLENMYVEHLPAVQHCVKLVVQSSTIASSELLQLIRSSIPHMLEVKLVDVTVTGDSDNPVDLTDFKHNPKLMVKYCHYNDSENTWNIEFHIKQQTTIASDKQK